MGCLKIDIEKQNYPSLKLAYSNLNLNQKSDAGDYRFGYQGSEKDFDVAEGDYTTHYRMLDTRLGRWFSTDPVFQPWQSTYNSMNNNPILNIDPLGNTIRIHGGSQKSEYFDWEVGKEYKGENVFIIETIASLEAYAQKAMEDGLGNVEILLTDENGVESGKSAKGNVVLDFISGGQYENEIIDIFNPENTSFSGQGGNSECYCTKEQQQKAGLNNITILHNPLRGLGFTDFQDDMGGDKQTAGEFAPMIFYFHEMGHAWLNTTSSSTMYSWSLDAFGRTGYRSPLKEEQWILKNVENPAAKTFNMGERKYYDMLHVKDKKEALKFQKSGYISRPLQYGIETKSQQSTAQ